MALAPLRREGRGNFLEARICSIRRKVPIVKRFILEREQEDLANTRYWLCTAKEYEHVFGDMGDEVYDATRRDAPLGAGPANHLPDRGQAYRSRQLINRSADLVPARSRHRWPESSRRVPISIGRQRDVPAGRDGRNGDSR